MSIRLEMNTYAETTIRLLLDTDKVLLCCGVLTAMEALSRCCGVLVRPSTMTCFEGGGNTRLLYCCTTLRVCRVAIIAVSTGVALCLYDIPTQHLSKEEGSHGCSTAVRCFESAVLQLQQ